MSDEPTAADLDRLACELPAWSYDPHRCALHRRLRFSAFGEALAAMVRIGVEADKADHHPEWTNLHDTVDVWLTTHAAGGVTARDAVLAGVIDGMFPAPDL